MHGSAEVRVADKHLAALASEGLYRADHHSAIEQGSTKSGRYPQEVVAAHVRRREPCAELISAAAAPVEDGAVCGSGAVP